MREESRQPATSSSVQWTVDAILPAISADYMLERTNVYIPNSSSQVVADRIVESLRNQSLSYKESEERKNSLLGESHNGLRFYLNLFSDSDDSSTLILEVQRLRGCSFAFRQICRDICRAAKGVATPPSTTVNKFPMPAGLPPRKDPEAVMEAEMARALSMISSPMVDSQLLGMDLLESLSKSTLTASLVLEQDCLAQMKNFIIAPLEEEVMISGLDAQRACQRKRQALAIVSNALYNSNECESLSSDTSFLEQVLECLTAKDPHCAAQAARCLHSLAASSPATKTFVMGLSDTLKSLQTSHHSLLDQECSKLLGLC